MTLLANGNYAGIRCACFNLVVEPETHLALISKDREFGFTGKIIAWGIQIEKNADAYVGVKICINDILFFPHTSTKKAGDDLCFLSDCAITFNNCDYPIKASDLLKVYATNLDEVRHNIHLIFLIKV